MECRGLLRDHYGVGLLLVGVAASPGAIVNANGFEPLAPYVPKRRGDWISLIPRINDCREYHFRGQHDTVWSG